MPERERLSDVIAETEGQVFHDDESSPTWSGCQRPSVSPHPRPSFLPGGGHDFSPLVAIFSPHHVGARSGLAQGLHPLAGGRLGEPVAVLSFGDQDVGVMQ
jgi:hypothetical protein